jgi:ribosomal protein S18 acetylase RimI-like enzyme
MTGSPFIIASFDTLPEASVQVVDAGLDRFNLSVASLTDVRPVGAFATRTDGRVVGGAVGRTWGRCCELQQLWVEPGCRSQGVGSRLLREFEDRARGRGCNVFYLTTLSFQAPEFYRRHGYSVLAEIRGYPDGIVKYLMQRIEP